MVPKFEHPYRYGAAVLHFCKAVGESLKDTRFVCQTKLSFNTTSSLVVFMNLWV